MIKLLNGMGNSLPFNKFLNMNLRFNPFLLIVIITFFLVNCKKGCTDPNAVNYDPDAKKDNGTCYNFTLPTNLNYTVTVDLGTKKVDVVATSIGANGYSFVFYELLDSSNVQFSSLNTASHTYSDFGQHKIAIRAHLNTNVYIEETYSIYVPENTDTTMSNAGYITPLSYPNYTLVWNDEFDDTLLNSNWIQEIGNGCPNLCGWGNNELQFYKAENTSLKNGFLTITAKEESFSGSNYTSSRIKTQGNINFKYGRIDIRAKLPYSQGIWPALWMLGENITTDSWPACGEIDIVELIGGSGYNDRTVHGTLHWDNNGYATSTGSSSLSTGKFNDEFHVFSILWDSSSIIWLRDDIQYKVIDITNLSAFHNNFFFIFNVAVGGNWPGNPNSSTVFPQQMVVDYVRVFQ